MDANEQPTPATDVNPQPQVPTVSAPTDPATSAAAPMQTDPVRPTVTPVEPANAPVDPLATAAAEAPALPIKPLDPLPQSSLPNLNSPSMVVGGEAGVSTYQVATDTPKQPLGKKKMLLGGGVVLAVALLAAGGVFGLYLPNKPENVWNTGVTRTGTAINKLVTDAQSAQKLTALTTSEITGDVAVKAGGGTYNGTFTAKLDSTNSDSALDVSINPKDAAAMKVGAKVLTTLDKGAQYPNVFFQLTGIKSLGLDGFFPGVSNYEGKWIVVSSDYIKTKASGATATVPTTTDSTITAKDITEVTEAVSKTSNDYLFTTDQSKAVLVNKGFINKETVEGVKAYHYRATINKAHAKDYCKALVANVATTSTFKKFVNDKDRSSRTQSMTLSCQDSVEHINTANTFDVWIDSHYKLIHKVRVFDGSNKKTYTDIGQTYKGDDNLNLFANYHDENAKVDVTSTFTTNMKNVDSKGEVHAKGTGSSPYTADAHFTVKGSSTAVKVAKPTGALKIEDVLKALGLNNL
ncbi:MAG: hypothetical protein ABIR37_00375 [Candidatus Saccharimonadales bacterium]